MKTITIESENLIEFIPFCDKFNLIIDTIADEHADTDFYSNINSYQLQKNLDHLNNAKFTILNEKSFKDFADMPDRVKKEVYNLKSLINYLNFLKETKTKIDKLKKSMVRAEYILSILNLEISKNIDLFTDKIKNNL